MSGPTAPDRVLVEQAFACGELAADIAADLDVPLEVVTQVWDDMTTAALSGDNATDLYLRTPGMTPKGRTLSPCGTHAAYNRHVKRGEDPCMPCRKADNAYRSEKRRRRAARTQSAA
jgi:hypothetical protein